MNNKNDATTNVCGNKNKNNRIIKILIITIMIIIVIIVVTLKVLLCKIGNWGMQYGMCK